MTVERIAVEIYMTETQFVGGEDPLEQFLPAMRDGLAALTYQLD